MSCHPAGLGNVGVDAFLLAGNVGPGVLCVLPRVEVEVETRESDVATPSVTLVGTPWPRIRMNPTARFTAVTGGVYARGAN